MSMYDDYVRYASESRAKYGARTLVAYEVGNFYEWYNCDQNLGCNVREVCDLLGVQSTRRSKAIAEVSRSNPQMGGVPAHAFETRYLPVLLAHDYTVVVVSQVSGPPTPQRRITAVHSSGTSLCVGSGSCDSSTRQHLASVVLCTGNVKARKTSPYFGRDTPARPVLLHAGCAVFDVSTGKSEAYEVATLPDDPEVTFDELRRLFVLYDPCEVLVLVDAGDVVCCGTGNDELVDRLCRHTRIPRSRVRHRTIETHDLKYHEHVLRKAFPRTGMLSAIEALDFERSPQALAAFVGLVQFVYEHDETLVRAIERPKVHFSPTTSTHGPGRVRLDYDAAEQLDVVAQRPTAPSLLTLLSPECVTASGRRRLRDVLLRPFVDPRVIRARHDRVEALIRNEACLTCLRKCLAQVCDVEKTFRRMRLIRTDAGDVAQLHASFNAVRTGVSAVDQEAVERALEVHRLEHIASHITSRLERDFDIDACVDGTSPHVFPRGKYADLDRWSDDVKTGISALEDLAASISADVGTTPMSKSACIFRVERVNCGGTSGRCWAVVGTPLRCVAAVKSSRSLSGLKNETVTSSVHRLRHVRIDEHSDRVAYAETLLDRGARETLHRVLTDLTVDAEIVELVSEFCERVADLDVHLCAARTALKRGYVRPTILVDDDAEEEVVVIERPSRISTTEMRHPVLEAIHERVHHVPNDLELERSGMLLYGMNAAGKSSLMKSLALNVIMAQAGMYVAASSFDLRPFVDVFTRVLSRDDLARGQSTFMVEMSELRGILKRCGPRSLVIGDEICSGTESVSALAIVGASLKVLARLGACFLFATHLHELTRLSILRPDIDASRLRIMHLRVTYDASTGRLVYERKLCDGQGPTVYGLEVCRALDMGAEFMDLARSIRRDVLGMAHEFALNKRSSYNTSVFVDGCAYCGKALADEVHHLVPRASADEHGMVRDPRHPSRPLRLNAAHNLLPVCSACHLRLHDKSSDRPVLQPTYVQTSDGIELRGAAVLNVALNDATEGGSSGVS